MVDDREAMRRRMRIDAVQPPEIHIVDGAAVAVAVHEVDQAAANALDGRDVQLHRPDAAVERPGAELDRALEGVAGIGDPEGHGAGGGPVHAAEALGEAGGLGVEDEIRPALAPERHVLAAVAGHLDEAEAREDPAEMLGVGAGELDEFEAVRAHRVGVGDAAGDVGAIRRDVHGLLPRMGEESVAGHGR
jgi:hypothetical protein